MMALAVAAILATLALPSYRAILEKRQVTSAAEQIGAFLGAVQVESVERNEPISVSYVRAAPDAWCFGVDNSATSCNCAVVDVTDADACTVDGELRIFDHTQLNYPDVVSGITGDGSFVFDPVRGLLLDHTDGTSTQLVSSEGMYSLTVDINASGRVNICSGNASKAVPGYESC